LSAEQERAVLESADEMWRLWTGFFDRLAAESGVASNRA
jgi:hypothetical protein